MASLWQTPLVVASPCAHNVPLALFGVMRDSGECCTKLILHPVAGMVDWVAVCSVGVISCWKVAPARGTFEVIYQTR